MVAGSSGLPLLRLWSVFNGLEWTVECFQWVQRTKVSVLCVHLKSYPCVHVAGSHWDFGQALLQLSVLRNSLCKGIVLPCHSWENLPFIVSVKELPHGTATWHCQGCCVSGTSACSCLQCCGVFWNDRCYMSANNCLQKYCKIFLLSQPQVKD